MRSIRLLCATAVLAFVLAGAEAIAVEPATSVAAPCTAPEYHQFDFWIGDWDAYEVDAKDQPPIARNHVDAILGGCVLREVYEQNDGLVGRSFTIYDATRGVWHQSWVTNRGQLLLLDGKREGRRIVLSGIDRSHAKPRLVRAWWESEGKDVRETATVSSDHGKTWKPLFDVLFRRHR